MQRLVDQVAIVTGEAQGIGGSVARRLAEEGAKVLVADIDMDAAANNVKAIQAAGNTAEAFRADVENHDDIRGMVNKAADLWGRLDILVNNAWSSGAIQDGSAVEVPEESWDKGIAILLKSVFLGAKYAVPEMQKVGAGNIVTVSSD